ncbi:MAG: hypothetical protein JWQ09_2702 [Segetibacter sp.]|nr:hypothetical protein [Segetibacter sp.]
MLSNCWLIISILLVCAILSVKAGKLTARAGLLGFIVGLLVFAGSGYTGIAMVAAFFLLGTTATSWGITQKQHVGLAEKNKGRRTAGQVIANAGVAAILGLLIVAIPGHKDLFRLMIAASLASATADTLSSELGNVYGKKFYNILTFKKDTRGLDGVVSIEGTLIGIAGSICIATVYTISYGVSISILLIIIAGTIGNLFDSVLGASLERKNYLNNNAVNFLNTAIAAFAIFIFYLFN